MGQEKHGSCGSIKMKELVMENTEMELKKKGEKKKRRGERHTRNGKVRKGQTWNGAIALVTIG